MKKVCKIVRKTKGKTSILITKPVIIQNGSCAPHAQRTHTVHPTIDFPVNNELFASYPIQFYGNFPTRWARSRIAFEWKINKKKTHAEGSALSSSVNNRRSVYFFSISLWFLEVLFLSYRMLCVPHLPLQHRQKKNPAPQYFSLSCILSTYKFIVVSTFIFKTACLLDKWFFRLGAMQTEKGQTHSTSERKSWKWWQLESDIRVYYSPRSNVAWVCGINGVLCANRAYEYEEEEGRSAAGA